MPGAGPLEYLSTPLADETTRIDTGVREGESAYDCYVVCKFLVHFDSESQWQGGPNYAFMPGKVPSVFALYQEPNANQW